MLVIREEQLRVFGRSVRRGFVGRLAARFAEIWPERSARLGGGCREFVEASVERALSYGLEREKDVARFVNLCFVWGRDFENRPEHAWARQILTSNLRPAVKIEEMALRTRLKLEAIHYNRRPA